MVGLITNIIQVNNNKTRVKAISIDQFSNELKNQTGFDFFSIVTTDGSILKTYFENKYLDAVKLDIISK